MAILFELLGFRESEALRLLRLARAEQPVLPPIGQLLARHRELVASGAELPAWARPWAGSLL